MIVKKQKLLLFMGILVFGNNEALIYYSTLKNNISLTINDIECIQIKSSLYTIDLPDDIWKNNDKIKIETSEKYRQNVHGDNEYCYISKDTYIEDLSDMVYCER